MKLQIISDKFMIFTSPAEVLVCGDALNKLVHKIQKENAISSWDNIRAEIYGCAKENLYFIYPENMKICLAEYVLPFLGEYFTD